MQKPSEGAVRAEKLAQLFHETYERLAPEYGYKTREASAVSWGHVPEQNKKLMIAVCRTLIDRETHDQSPTPQDVNDTWQMTTDGLLTWEELDEKLKAWGLRRVYFTWMVPNVRNHDSQG